MIVGKKNILDWFGATQKSHWFLYEFGKRDSGVRKMESNPDEGATHTDAMRELSETVNRIGYGKYTLIANNGPKIPTRGFLVEDFEISSQEAKEGTPIVSGIPTGYVSKEDMQQAIKEAIDQHKQKTELEELRKKAAQLEKDLRQAEKQDGLSRLAGVVADYVVPMYFQKAQVAGIPQQLPHNEQENAEAMQLTAEEEDKLSNIIAVFVQAAPNEWLDLLEKLAAKVQSNPAIINTFKAFL